MLRGDARSGLCGALPVEIADRDQGAVLGEALSGRFADTAGAAGNQRDASLRPLDHMHLPFANPAAKLSQPRTKQLNFFDL